MTTKISGSQINNYTIETAQLSNTAVAAFAQSLAPKVLYANVANSAFTVLDDTAVNVGGGYIVVTGTDFVDGATVLIDTTPASAVTYVNSTTLRVQVPTKAAASYNLYVVNPDGGVGIKVSGLTYSTDPTWVTASPLDNQLANTAFGVNLSATSATSYAVAAGSTLPAGTSLLANGYFYGTVSVGSATTYSFNVVATDAENQDSSKTFQVTVTIDPPDSYFNYTTLLLQADNVSNNATNSSFVDSSNNSLTVTSSGTPIQGSQNPFGVGNWSNYFDGSGDYLSFPSSSNLAFGSGDFTVEAWVYLQSTALQVIYCSGATSDNNFFFSISPTSSFLGLGTKSAWVLQGSVSLSLNTWYHVAVTRSGTTLRQYVNGTEVGTTTNSTNFLSDGTGSTGSNSQSSQYFTGYISNLRVIKGTALYTSAFTPSTTPLTAVANTQLLTCQSNNFKDTSTNGFTVTPAGNSTVERFNPFGTNAIVYSPNTDTGSTYFNGSTDYLTITNNANLQLGSGNWTLEGWVYPNSSAQQTIAYINGNAGSYAAIRLDINGGGTRPLQLLSSNDGSNWAINYNAGSLQLYAWNHFALVRSGSTFLMFINGTQVGTTQSMTGTLYGGTTHTIGCHISSSATNFFSGYLSNVKLTKGTALYSTTFTPSTTRLTAGVGTELLLLSNNAGIYDATEQNNIQTVGDAKVRTNIYKYGTGSIYLDGTGDYLSVPHTSGIDLSSGDFTIEAWVYWNSYVAGSAIIAKGTGAYGAYLIYVGDASGGTEVDFYTSVSGSAWSVSGLNFAINPSLGSWHHLAVTRSGNVYRTFFNGTLANSITQAGTLTSQSAAPPLVVGRYNAGNTFDGYIDDLRITKGYARYTANFTPPTAKLPNR